METPIIDQKTYLNMELLRFTTAGSVDDGKSTLIGRLLYDSKAIFDDQYEAIKESSLRRGEDHVNLAHLTDGLKAEREQGITIDVAYRYFATPKRKFIIADTPGHIQYTRNMVTGASTANLAIILVDARKGIVEQTCRHAYIASLLQIPHVVLCVNKMDLVEYSEEVFARIQREFDDFSARLDVRDVRTLPISALNGDNVVERSTKMPWYQGPTLLYLLENIHIAGDLNQVDFRFPVQYVIRPQRTEHHDFRGYAGRIAGGVVRPGDEVRVLPSGLSAKVRSIETMEGPIETACAPMSVTITLEEEIDVSRGDLLVGANNSPEQRRELEVMLCWFSETPLNRGGRYVLMHAQRQIPCMIKEVFYKVDINTLEKIQTDRTVSMNDIACVTLKIAQPLFCDSYSRNRTTGSLVLVDEATNATVAAGMLH